MKASKPTRRLAAICLTAVVFFASTSNSRAHCDTLDGPVVKAAERALAERNVNLALIWVQDHDEAEIRRVFDQTLIVRALSPAARDLADRYFFETLVRLHRAGEGAPYTGLKPAGRDPGLAITTGDKALETGELGPVLHLLSSALNRGLREHFNDTLGKRRFAPGDIAAGRAYVQAYVSYIHYVEAVHQAIQAATHAHPASEKPQAAMTTSHDRH
jgi:hypothetical protein